MDTLRADHLGCYGGPVATPHLDRLASRGVLFERAYAHAASTGPSHSSLFTSLLPFEHGVIANRRRLDLSHHTLAEALNESGWRTFGVVSLGVLQGKFGFGQGFEVFRDDFSHDWFKDAEEVTAEALDVLAEPPVDPFFLFAHYCDPHAPYAPGDLEYPIVDLELDGNHLGELEANGRRFSVEVPLAPGLNRFRFASRRPAAGVGFQLDVLRITSEGVRVQPGDWKLVEQRRRVPSYHAELPAALELIAEAGLEGPVEARFNFKERLEIDQIRDRYAGEVRYADRHIGALLDELETRGLLDDTLVIFTSDHGEGLGDHDHVTHVQQLYDTLVRVPLIMSMPGRIPEGRRIDDLVSLVDVYPTVAELMEVPAPDPTSGSSLIPLLDGGAVAERPVFIETNRPEAIVDKKATVANGHKYIHTWLPDGGESAELYDLDRDPGELDDLVTAAPEMADRLRMLLWDRVQSAARADSIDVELSDEEAARLRALGYVH
jgi:arylsulfatase A-like enzyme